MLNYVFIRSAYGNRTRVSAVRGPRPRPLDESAMSLRYEERKLGDSNPRYGYPYGSLANCWFQPLTQTSKSSADSVFLKCGANIEGIFELCKLYQSFYYAIQCGFYPIRGLFHCIYLYLPRLLHLIKHTRNRVYLRLFTIFALNI